MCVVVKINSHKEKRNKTTTKKSYSTFNKHNKLLNILWSQQTINEAKINFRIGFSYWLWLCSNYLLLKQVFCFCYFHSICSLQKLYHANIKAKPIPHHLFSSVAIVFIVQLTLLSLKYKHLMLLFSICRYFIFPDWRKNSCFVECITKC